MIKQKKVDELFWLVLGHGAFDDREDCERISKVIKAKLDIEISVAEAGYVWKKVSKQNDVDWMIIKSDEQIVDIFTKFYKKFWGIKFQSVV